MPNSRGDDPHPEVTVVMAAFNVAGYLDDALASVRRQSLASIEIIVVDDGSTDKTPEILQRHAQDDPRIKPMTAGGAGPAGARNLAISQATGRWIAVIDADDLVDEHRLAQMVEAGDELGADAVADNMIAFYEPATTHEHAWIDRARWPSNRWLTFDDVMAGGLGDPPAPELGYLKPILRRERLIALGQPYRDDLLIGEDFDLMARWTSAGLSYLYMPDPGYRYRRRASSISYRLSTVQIDQMIAALDGMDPDTPRFNAESLGARKASLENLKRYAHRVERLKRRDYSALPPLLIDADSRRRLTTSVREGIWRRVASSRA